MRSMLPLACSIFVLQLASPPSRAGAPGGDASAAIAALREQVTYAQYPEAIASGTSLLARGDLAARQRNETLELIAIAQIANRQAQDAQRTLATLYARDPEHRPNDPDASPPVVAAFARARESSPSAIAIDLAHSSPGTLPRREPPLIEVRASRGADAIHEIRLAYRIGDETAWSQVVMNPGASGLWSGRIPIVGSDEHGLDVDYQLIALAPSGAELARLGTATEPLELRVPAEAPGPLAVARAAEPAPDSASIAPFEDETEPSRSIAEEPGFWVVIGLVVAGGIAAGIGISLAVGPQGPEPGSLGTVTLIR
jgi:hypothetical protein